MDIFNVDLTKLVSYGLLQDSHMVKICESINTELQSLISDSSFAKSSYDVDNANVAILEHIAWQLNSELFFVGKTLAEKEQLVKEAIKLHRKKGTKYAVEKSIQMIIPNAKVEEWFEYDGNPYHFRVLNADRRTLKEILTIISLINIMKSLRSWIDNEFIAIDEGLIDLNLLLDMDILMTANYNIRYIKSSGFIYLAVINNTEIESNEQTIYVSVPDFVPDPIILQYLLNAFLLEDNLNQQKYSSDVDATTNAIYQQAVQDWYEATPNIGYNKTFDHFIIQGVGEVENQYRQLLLQWIEEQKNSENYNSVLIDLFGEQLEEWYAHQLENYKPALISAFEEQLEEWYTYYINNRQHTIIGD